MKRHDHYYASNSNNCGKYVMLAMLAIFFISISAFAIVEIRNFYTDESIVQKILMNSFKTSKVTPYTTQPEFVFTETNQNSERLPRALALEQNSTTSPANNTTQKSNYYYEEQKPVVVYSKTDVASSPIAYKQLKEVPPKQDTDDDDEDPYRKPLPEDEDYDYFGQPSSSNQRSPPPSYYRQPPYQSAPDSYYRSQPNANNYYRSPPAYPQYFDDSREDFPGPQQKEQTESEEARNSQYSDYNNNNYYRQWHYATPPPPAPAMSTAGSTSPNGRLAPTRSGQDNRKVQQQQQQQQRQPPNRDPYAAYMDDYDDMPPQSHKPQPYPFAQYRKTPQQQHRYQQQQQIAQYRTPSTSSAIQAEEKHVETRPQMDVLTIIKSLKSMWDLYQSFSSSWNTIAERRNREEELEQQKLKQLQQIRVNSKKPPSKFNNKRNQTNVNSNGNNKNPKKQSTTTTTSTTLAPTLESLEMPASSEEKMVAKVKKQPPAKVEPRKAAKGDKINAKNTEGLRDKRQATMETMSTDVGEGRYIKGDPLKGYYDFVITEGSYKFWAAFQVGTALLIIYSTFAAIYYSKVNPLVSDYDYTDYLGGARSLSGGDLDFVDDDDTTAVAGQKAQPKSWLDWLPRSGHSLKFILDAIDKLPVDHAEESIKDQEQEASESNTDYVNSNVMAAERQEGPDEVDNIDYAAEEGSGGGDADQIVENRDNVKVIRDSNESTEEDVNIDHSKAM